jgi:hypothetical protein
MSREQTVAVAAGFGGLALVLGVVLWRLAGASPRADVETICHAEARSGLSIARDMPALDRWLRGHLTTPAGNELLSRLGDVSMDRRAARLLEAASALGVGACPMAQSYDSLVTEGRYRGDLQRLCSYVTFPDLVGADDAARLAALEHWIQDAATDPRTRALDGPLRSAATPAERARVLRTASRAMGVLTCDVARTLETPPPPVDAGE